VRRAGTPDRAGAAAAPLSFFLRFAEAEGGAFEQAPDSTLVLLPATLRQSLDLPEEFTITAEPEVAREDGALLLVHGHPLLDRAADAVLERGDAGCSHLAWPASRMPSAGNLVERARESIQVDHGRIEAAGPPPLECWAPVLRAGVLVSYATSLEDRFQEREEAWVDAHTRLPLEPALRDFLTDRAREPGPGMDRPALGHDLAAAVAAADAMITSRALARREELARQTRGQREQELARAGAYYEAALTSIAARKAAATPERSEVLAAQIQVTAVERDRRLAEIAERFEPRHDLTPFRLHLIWVPALSLAALVRRGATVFPLTLVWIPGVARFAPMRCPNCDALAVLVAGRDRLGCRICLPAASMAVPTPNVPPSISVVAPAPVEVARRSPSAKTKARHEAAKPPRPPTRPPVDTARLERVGGKLAFTFWDAVVQGERWRGKVTIPHSPMAALARVYGHPGPLVAIGIPPGVPLLDLRVERTRASRPSGRGRPATCCATAGTLLTRTGLHRFTLRWDVAPGAALVGEVLPLWAPDGTLPPREVFDPDAARAFSAPPSPRLPLDPAAAQLWETVTGRFGLHAALRCLALWWRLDATPGPDSIGDEALRLALIRRVCARANLPTPQLDQPELWGTDPAEVEEATKHLLTVLGPPAQQPW
jgi:hypothetical protein